MKKRYIIIVGITVIGLTLLFNFNKDYSTTSIPKENIEDKEVPPLEENNKEIISENINESEERKELEINVEQKEVTSIPENTTTTEQVTKKEEQPVTSKETKPVEKPKETTVEIQSSTPVPVKEATEWEKLGITEYDYYNKPMWKWAKVDFSVDELGTKENALRTCDKAGNKILNPCKDENGFQIPNCDLEPVSGSFTCYELTSYSGRFLGYYLKVTKLID